MANVIEEAKSGRAACRTCKKPIAKGELRLGVELQNAVQRYARACSGITCPAPHRSCRPSSRQSLDAFSGNVPNRGELDQMMSDSLKKGHAKPGGFPYVDRAPTGRAKCMQCEEPIAKDSFRVAVEREIDTGTMVTRGAGYLHPKCVDENLENTGGSKADLMSGIRSNSRLPSNDLEAVIAEIGEPA